MMQDIRHGILQYLADNDNGTIITLNDRLIELLGTNPVRIYKGVLRGMTQDQVAEISGNIGFLGSTIGGIEQNLHNQQISGRILPNGYKELQNTIAKNTQTLLVQKQIDDFHKTVWYRRQGFIWVILGIIIATLIGLLQLCNKN